MLATLGGGGGVGRAEPELRLLFLRSALLFSLEKIQDLISLAKYLVPVWFR